MKFLVFASVLLSGFVAAAQNNVPNWFDPSATQGTKRNSDLCYAIRMFKVGPEEKVQPYLEAPRQTTCIPANRYRTEYIPNPTPSPGIIRTGACPMFEYLGDKDGTGCSFKEKQLPQSHHVTPLGKFDFLALQTPAGRGESYKSIFEMFLLYTQVLH